MKMLYEIPIERYHSTLAQKASFNNMGISHEQASVASLASFI